VSPGLRPRPRPRPRAARGPRGPDPRAPPRPRRFGGKKSVEADVPGDGVTVRAAMAYARDTLLTDRPELFMRGDTVKPGILVLVNDVDWELTGREDTELGGGDTVTFISTLHGG